MNTAAKISALLVFVGLVSLSGVASAQDAPPPPPPPPPSSGPEATPPPAADPAPPPATPHTPPPAAAPGRCGVAQPAPGCHQPPPRYYRPPPRYRPRFRRLGLYIGGSGGALAFIGAKGPMEHISAGGSASAWIGMNFGRLALELGFIGSFHQEQFSELDNTYWSENELFLWGVTLDAKLNLVRPSWRRRFVPYLQAGVGAYGLVGDYYEDGAFMGRQGLASGGGLQLGGGIDIYLTRWLVLGGRVLYRGIILGRLKCGSDGDRCVSNDEEDRTVLHGLAGEINMSIVF